MIDMPVPSQALIQRVNPSMQYVTFVPQAAPMMQQQMQPQQMFDSNSNYNYVYQPEPTIYPQIVQVPKTAPLPRRQTSNLPPELLGLLSHPEL